MDLDDIFTFVDIDRGLQNEINKEVKIALELLNIDNETPKQIVEKIKLFADEFVSKKYSPNKLKRMKTYVSELSTLWGKMIEKEHNWKWKNKDFIGRTDIDDMEIFIVSPNEYFYCNPLGIFVNIMIGREKNIILTLFENIGGIEEN